MGSGSCLYEIMRCTVHPEWFSTRFIQMSNIFILPEPLNVKQNQLHTKNQTNYCILEWPLTQKIRSIACHNSRGIWLKRNKY